MTAPSSFNVSGLLGGTAGSIDTSALVDQLMQVAALPQTGLKNQLAVQQAIEGAYQSISTKISAMQTAAQGLTDVGAWSATVATSSNPAVVATSSATATAGTTTFDVLALAKAQISTIAADANGNVASTPANGVTITTGDGVAHQLSVASGSAADVAAAVNSANIGIRAAVVTTDTGTVLQLTAGTSGLANSFTVAGVDSAAQTVVAAQNAKIGVGTPGAGGYTVSSATNTFTGVVPGVTFSVSALATGVSVTVASDQQAIGNKVKALVDAVNTASSTISSNSSSGAILQGSSDVQTLAQALSSAVSKGTVSGGSLKTYGIDIDKDGVLSFDATAFAAAYVGDPAGTQTAINGFAATLSSTADSAIDPTVGSLTLGIAGAKSAESSLTTQINNWASRLADTQQRLQAKYAAMETALAKLQSQSTYLTSMFKSMTTADSSSSN
jgi:flagellar hook-associated protein 2